MTFSVSGLSQAVREAALVDAGGRRRQMEETGLTWVFLQTLRVWLRDGTPGQAYARRFLDRRLAWLNPLDQRCREQRTKPDDPKAEPATPRRASPPRRSSQPHHLPSR